MSGLKDHSTSLEASTTGIIIGSAWEALNGEMEVSPASGERHASPSWDVEDERGQEFHINSPLNSPVHTDQWHRSAAEHS